MDARDRDASSPAVVLPDVLRVRLRKAAGHLNAAQRWLCDDIDRGLWSAAQAKARFAESWLWLNDERIDLPPLERYLARDVVRARLESFEHASKSKAMAAAWQEVETAERAVRETVFPVISGPTTVNKEERKAIEEGLARVYGYLDGLCHVKRVVADVVAQRFMDLRYGDCVGLDDGTLGRVIVLEGLTVKLLVPATDTSPTIEIRRYDLAHAQIDHFDRPKDPCLAEYAIDWAQARDAMFRPDEPAPRAVIPDCHEPSVRVDVNLGYDECGEMLVQSSLGERTARIFPWWRCDCLPDLIEWLQAISMRDLPIAIAADGQDLSAFARAGGQLLVDVVDFNPWYYEGEHIIAVVDGDVFIEAFRAGLEGFLREHFEAHVQSGSDEDVLNSLYRESVQHHPFLAGKREIAEDREDGTDE